MSAEYRQLTYSHEYPNYHTHQWHHEQSQMAPLQHIMPTNYSSEKLPELALHQQSRIPCNNYSTWSQRHQSMHTNYSHYPQTNGQSSEIPSSPSSSLASPVSPVTPTTPTFPSLHQHHFHHHHHHRHQNLPPLHHDLPSCSTLPPLPTLSYSQEYRRSPYAVDLKHQRALSPPVTTIREPSLDQQRSMMGQFSIKRTSTAQRHHQCTICHKRFTRPSCLQTHHYSHTGEKPFPCKHDGCGKRFSVVSNLRRHMKVHREK